MNKMLEPWGFMEENNYESLQSQSSTSEKNQNDIDNKQSADIERLEKMLEDEIKRSKGEDSKHDAYESQIKTNEGNIKANSEAIADKADKEHTHEITDLRQGGSENIVFDANTTYDTTPKGE